MSCELLEALTDVEATDLFKVLFKVLGDPLAPGSRVLFTQFSNEPSHEDALGEGSAEQPSASALSGPGVSEPCAATAFWPLGRWGPRFPRN
jgi:hypothetical protein